jgi:hypothetical protein
MPRDVAERRERRAFAAVGQMVRIADRHRGNPLASAARVQLHADGVELPPDSVAAILPRKHAHPRRERDAPGNLEERVVTEFCPPASVDVHAVKNIEWKRRPVRSSRNLPGLTPP